MLTFIWKLKDSGAHKKGSVRTQSPITGSSNLCAERFIRKNCPWQRKPKKHLRHWLQFWQLKTWIHDNIIDLTIKCNTGQHSKFLRRFSKVCFEILFQASIFPPLRWSVYCILPGHPILRGKYPSSSFKNIY